MKYSKCKSTGVVPIIADVQQAAQDTSDFSQNKEVDSVIAQPEKSSCSPLQVTSAALNRKMGERGTNGAILDVEQAKPALITEGTGMYDNIHTYHRTCVTEMTVIGWLSVIIDVIGLAGNAAVIWLLGFRMHRNAISVYILNLAVADFLYLCFQLVDSLQELNTYFPASIEIYHFDVFHFVFYYSYITGLSFLSVISLERCLSVLCPIWYRCRRPRHASFVMCVLVWVLSFPFPFLLSHYCLDWYTPSDWNCCLLFRLSTSGYLLLLFVILSGSNLALTIRMFCGSRHMSLTRLYVTVLLTVLVFIFCGLPYSIGHCLIGVIYSDVYYYSCYLFKLLFLLTSVNSCANPIIYFFVGSFRQWQRQNLQRVLQRALQDTPEDNECGGSLSQGTLELSGSRLA
ncbi:mas-related G-protein coupled receptor member X2-like [Perognathus longimembris pacificus]|uniref:mas-related G-protein coupled receptor member X2-like n=1 Tax=Perognathus longimembris pacificus TaxID=214514 RepID=UPI002018F4DF|nr:mas-related G-protein coupled receptor member X2-like [Perognathus longimembris pacificus]